MREARPKVLHRGMKSTKDILATRIYLSAEAGAEQEADDYYRFCRATVGGVKGFVWEFEDAVEPGNPEIGPFFVTLDEAVRHGRENARTSLSLAEHRAYALARFDELLG